MRALQPISHVSADDLISLGFTWGTPSLIGAVLLFGTPGALEPARLVAAHKGRLFAAPRLEQRLECLLLGEERPIWMNDPNFRLADRLSVHRCASPGGWDGVFRMTSDSLTTPLSPIRAQLMADGVRDTLRVLRALPAEMTRVAKTWRTLAPALRTQLDHSSLNQLTGPRQHIVMVSGNLVQIYAAVNDVLLAMITGALRRLLARRGGSTHSIVISVPISFQRDTSDQKLRNQSAVVPVHLPAKGERLTDVVKFTPPGVSNVLLQPAFRLLFRLGLSQLFVHDQQLIHTFMTHVRGQRGPLDLGSCPVNTLIPLASAGGNISVSFAALSSAGRLTVTLLADPDTCPPARVTER